MRNLVLLLSLTLMKAMGQDASGNPVIFHASPTALAGDLLYIQGSGFGSSPHVQYSYNDSNWISLVVLTSGSETAMVQLPSSQGRLPDLITIHISADGSHWSTPVYVNQAKALSFDTTEIAPGSHFRIFGRNLIFSRTPSIKLVDTADSSVHAATANTGASTAYLLAAVAPSDIKANHTYNVYVSNGYNGNGTSGSQTVAPSQLQGRSSGGDYWGLGLPWAADLNFTGNIYNIRTDPRLSLHASGNGSPTDKNAIDAAIFAASQAGGGIIYLPAGTYDLYYTNGCGLTLNSRVALMGAGAANTFVNFGYGTAPPADQGGWALCLGTQAGASDITFTNVNQSGQWPQSAVGLGGNETFLQRTKWNIDTARWLVFQNNKNLTIQNSSIVQSLDPSYNGPLNLDGSSDFLIRGNSIKYVAGALTFNGITNGVLEANNIVRNAGEAPPSWVVTHVVVANFATNFMLLDNLFGVTAGTLPLQNDGETIGSEGGGPTRYDEFRGTVTSAGANYVTDYSQNFNWSTNNALPNLHVGAIIAIVAGKGFGQWATVTYVSPDGHTVDVDKSWAVLPVAGSRYATFDWSAANWIVANNQLSNNEKGIEFFDCSIRDMLIENNTLTNNGEILLSPTEQPNGAGLFNVVLGTQILNNTLVDNDKLRPAAISAVAREDNQVTNFGTSIIGLEVRDNAITGFTPNTIFTESSLDDAKALAEGFNIYWQWQTLANFEDSGIPSILGTVLQDNTLNDSAVAYHLNSGVYETGLAANVLNHVGTAKVDATIPGATHASVGTVTAVVSKTGNTSDVWNQVTIGSLPASKLAGEPASTTSFTLAPSLFQIGSGSDSLSMLAEPVTGDLTAIVRISIPSGSSAATRGAIVFRDGTSSLSAFVSVGQLQSGELFFQWRPYQGAPVSSGTVAHGNTPLWIKLNRSGGLFTAYSSDDGNSWSWAVLLGSFDDSSYLVGLESFSDSLSGPSLKFDHVSVP